MTLRRIWCLSVLVFTLAACTCIRNGLTQMSDEYCAQHPDAPQSRCWWHHNT